MADISPHHEESNFPRSCVWPFESCWPRFIAWWSSRTYLHQHCREGIEVMSSMTGGTSLLNVMRKKRLYKARIKPQLSMSATQTHWLLQFLQLRSSNPETRSSSRHDRGMLSHFYYHILPLPSITEISELPCPSDERGLGSLPSSTQDQRQTSAEDSDQWQHTIHTFCTSNGSPYLNFQTRIM